MIFTNLFKKRKNNNEGSSIPKLCIETNSSIIEGKYIKEYVGLILYGGNIAPLIEVGSEVPISKSYTFSTTEDGQDQITIKLCRCSDLKGENYFSLGEFKISGIPNLPAKEPLIQVTFYAENKDISISAKDLKNSTYLEVIRVS